MMTVNTWRDCEHSAERSKKSLLVKYGPSSKIKQNQAKSSKIKEIKQNQAKVYFIMGVKILGQVALLMNCCWNFWNTNVCFDISIISKDLLARKSSKKRLLPIYLFVCCLFVCLLICLLFVCLFVVVCCLFVCCCLFVVCLFVDLFVWPIWMLICSSDAQLVTRSSAKRPMNNYQSPNYGTNWEYKYKYT